MILFYCKMITLNYQSLRICFKHFSSAEMFWSFTYASKLTHKYIKISFHTGKHAGTKNESDLNPV